MKKQDHQQMEKNITELFDVAKRNEDTHLLIMGAIDGRMVLTASTSDQVSLIQHLVECIQNDVNIKKMVYTALKVDEIMQKKANMVVDEYMEEVYKIIRGN